jgi:hypothetical protein
MHPFNRGALQGSASGGFTFLFVSINGEKHNIAVHLQKPIAGSLKRFLQLISQATFAENSTLG